MSESRTIISGCGISWSGQERKTWVRLLKFVGADILDVGGPAVSNQWILNRAAEALMDNLNIARIIIQLTNIGKLDVEIFGDRLEELVHKDCLRNFVIDGIWPSSSSIEHASKALWRQWLFSPRLEIQDIQIKTRLLAEVCKHRDIELIVIQGYPIPWDDGGTNFMQGILDNPDHAWYEQYKTSDRYSYHDHAAFNSVPELGWQLEQAKKMSQRFWPEIMNRISRLETAFYLNHD